MAKTKKLFEVTENFHLVMKTSSNGTEKKTETCDWVRAKVGH